MGASYYKLDWSGLSWSDWHDFYSTRVDWESKRGNLGYIPITPGVYRIRHKSEERDGLEYIGESGNVHRRILQLSGRVYDVDADQKLAAEMPYRSPHTAGPCIWAIGDSAGPEFEVSIAIPDGGDNDQVRKSVEASLIAQYRKERGVSPTANFARIIDGYKQSTYSSRDDSYRGGPLAEDDEEPNSEPGIAPTDWRSSSDVLSQSWMGLEWSEPTRLKDRLNNRPSTHVVYRIWYEGESPPLAYIGQTKEDRATNRFYGHENTFGSEAFFSYAERPDLDAKHKREEIETDLIGTHYLATGEAPIAQFGFQERLPNQ